MFRREVNGPYGGRSLLQVRGCFFDNIIKLHSVLCSIVSDHDPVFTSTFWSKLFCLSGVQLRMSTAFPCKPTTIGLR
jgi:hypothetical protein